MYKSKLGDNFKNITACCMSQQQNLFIESKVQYRHNHPMITLEKKSVRLHIE